VDITFGFSSTQANLMILMTIDDHYKGIPIAYIIFTACTDAKAIHADYDTALNGEANWTLYQWHGYQLAW
jgi:hypothetical protein